MKFIICLLDAYKTYKTYKTNTNHLFLIRSDAATRFCLFFKLSVIPKLRLNLWCIKRLVLMLVFLFAICNSMITAYYLSSFSFEQTNNTFSYLGFIILSFTGITILNAKWIKIVAEHYAKKF